MTLSRFERAVLANQLHILEKLYPEEAGSFARKREALELGYESHYESALQDVSEDTMAPGACMEVIDILDMFLALELAKEKFKPISGVEDSQVTYAGFDGNNETKQMGYARWLCEVPNCRFDSLDPGKNSHMPTLDRYRRQLREWRDSPDKLDLSEDDVLRIAGAAVYPKDSH